jgi:hypothetical protein
MTINIMVALQKLLLKIYGIVKPSLELVTRIMVLGFRFPGPFYIKTNLLLESWAKGKLGKNG